MTFRVEPVADANLDRYQAFIDSQLEATAYHNPGWLLATEQAYGHRGWLITATDGGGELTGALPVCQLRRPAGGQLVSLPFCDLGGPLADSTFEQAREALLTGALELMDRTGIHQLVLRERGQWLSDGQAGELPGAGKVSLVAHLPETSVELFDSFRAKLRSQIRKAEKNGLTASVETGPAALKAFYPVFAANMHRLGSPVHSRAWFAALKEHYGDRLVVGLVRLGHRPVAAGIVLIQGRSACIPWASTLAEFNYLAPNMLLYWQLLRYVTDNGCREFDFGRSTPGDGTYRFKRQWGAQPMALRWRDYQSDGTLAERPATIQGRPRQWAEACWQRLPLSVANRIGPRVRKHISL